MYFLLKFQSKLDCARIFVIPGASGVVGDGGGKNKIRAGPRARSARGGFYNILILPPYSGGWPIFVYGEKTHESELRIKLAAHFRTNLQYLHPPNVLREKLLPTSKKFAEICDMFRTGKFEFS
jgi:hypothetical protein